jgi:uncharacterized protein with HEPN domain
MKTTFQKWLLDAVNACRVISGFTRERSFTDYDGDLMLRSAVERQFEIVGEALNRVQTDNPSVVDRVPEIRRIVGLRNRIIHGYDTVDNQIVWDIVQTELPALIKQLDTLIDEM